MPGPCRDVLCREKKKTNYHLYEKGSSLLTPFHGLVVLHFVTGQERWMHNVISRRRGTEIRLEDARLARTA